MAMIKDENYRPANIAMRQFINDENNNINYYGDNELFKTKEEAKKALDSLINCRSCINCRDCNDCSNCSYCRSCINCRDCNDCSNCSYCSYCSNCLFCNDCINCRDCNDCSKCSYCSYCSNCLFCNDCNDCSNCSYCRYCRDCRYCNDCSYCNDCRNCNDCRYCSDFKENPQRYTSKKIGSRNAQTMVYWVNGNVQVITGCFKGNLEEFEKAICETHQEESEHYKDYMELIELLKKII